MGLGHPMAGSTRRSLPPARAKVQYARQRLRNDLRDEDPGDPQRYVHADVNDVEAALLSYPGVADVALVRYGPTAGYHVGEPGADPVDVADP